MCRATIDHSVIAQLPPVPREHRTEGIAWRRLHLRIKIGITVDASKLSFTAATFPALPIASLWLFEH